MPASCPLCLCFTNKLVVRFREGYLEDRAPGFGYVGNSHGDCFRPLSRVTNHLRYLG